MKTAQEQREQVEVQTRRRKRSSWNRKKVGNVMFRVGSVLYETSKASGAVWGARCGERMSRRVERSWRNDGNDELNDPIWIHLFLIWSYMSVQD